MRGTGSIVVLAVIGALAAGCGGASTKTGLRDALQAPRTDDPAAAPDDGSLLYDPGWLTPARPAVRAAVVQECVDIALAAATTPADRASVLGFLAELALHSPQNGSLASLSEEHVFRTALERGLGATTVPELRASFTALLTLVAQLNTTVPIIYRGPR